MIGGYTDMQHGNISLFTPVQDGDWIDDISVVGWFIVTENPYICLIMFCLTF